MHGRPKHPGQAMVEFMLVLPILLLLLYGTVEVARLIFIYSSVTNASRQAARYGATAGEENGLPRYLDCEGIRDVANESAFVVTFDDINITYDRGVDEDGDQVPISGVDPSPEADSCPVEDYTVRNGDRIVVQVSATYEPIVPVVPIDPMEIISSSARTFLISVPILGSAVPTGFAAETSTPSQTVSPTSFVFTPTFTLTSPVVGTQVTIVVPPQTRAPTYTITPSTPSKTPPPTRTATITPTAINCTGLTGVSHGPLITTEDYMEMEIINNTNHTLLTAQVYIEWNHDTGHTSGNDSTLHLIQASLGNTFWNGDLLAPSTYLTEFHPSIPQGTSKIRFMFHQTYDSMDGTERILITISTPGCVNYPIDSRK
ncbi:MAG: TadE family protein [Chloroflexota bacterium]